MKTYVVDHKICFRDKYGKLSLNYPCYPFLTGALTTLLMHSIIILPFLPVPRAAPKRRQHKNRDWFILSVGKKCKIYQTNIIDKAILYFTSKNV